MNDILTINDLNNQRLQFWSMFFSKCYPNGYYQEKDIELSEYIRTKYNLSLDWVDEFTKYYDGVLDDEDGYVENPRKVSLELNDKNLLEIEFHPGDTIFYLNKENIGCTGPHFYIHKISWVELNELIVKSIFFEDKFFLLLPMVYVDEIETDEALNMISQCLIKLPFKEEDYEIIGKCIINNIRKK
jgi:hypothetical protein